MHDLNICHTEDHHILIPQLAKTFEAKSYLELGIWDGDCIVAVASAMSSMRGSDYHAIGVDRAERPRCREQHSLFGTFEYILTDTLQFLASEQAKTYAPFDLVFIDADHNAAAVEADFNAVFPLVADQGVILFHDTWPGTPELAGPYDCIDAWKVAVKLGSNTDYESLTLPYSPGLTIVRKRTKHLLWEP